MQELAKHSQGFTGADLAALVQEAALIALTENLDATVVGNHHFQQAFQASFWLVMLIIAALIDQLLPLCNTLALTLQM